MQPHEPFLHFHVTTRDRRMHCVLGPKVGIDAGNRSRGYWQEAQEKR